MSRASDIEEQAAAWLVRQREPHWSASDQAQLDAWLDASMAHKAAFWRLEHVWDKADQLSGMVLTDPFKAEPPPPKRNWLPSLKQIAIAASLVGVVLWAAHWFSQPGARVETAVGGHKVVLLPDGSKVELNTATAIRATTTDSRREVWLERGEAYFEIKKSQGQQFIVHAGPRVITVLGTKFSVRRDGELVRVDVVEGHVRIDNPQAADDASARIISVGDVAVAEGSSTLVSSGQLESVQDGLAWRQGMLKFVRTPLGDVVAEFNRYNQTQLVVVDPVVADIRIGGTFQANNVDAFVRLLTNAFGLRIDSGPGIVTIAQ